LRAEEARLVHRPKKFGARKGAELRSGSAFMQTLHQQQEQPAALTECASTI
jgi:hypothetical protein